MWKATITRADPHPDGLQLRLAFGPPNAKWVKFCDLVLVLDELQPYERDYLLRRLHHLDEPTEADTPLW